MLLALSASDCFICAAMLHVFAPNPTRRRVCVLGAFMLSHILAQVRLFDGHFGGVIAKGTLLPLNSSALPPGTIILRQSQVKAPTGKTFWSSWTAYWQQTLLWAHQVHSHNTQTNQQQGLPQLSRFACQAGSCNQPCVSNSSSSGAGVSVATPGTTAAAATAGEVALQAAVAAATAAAAAASGSRGVALRCFNAQDQPWLQQLWYIHDAQQMVGCLQAQGLCSPIPAQPLPPGCLQQQQQQPPQAAGVAGSSSSTTRLAPTAPYGAGGSGNSSSSTSTGSQTGGAGPAASCSSRGCQCSAVLEVVCRPPDSSSRTPDLRINKNLLLLLHHAGVPEEVFTK